MRTRWIDIYKGLLILLVVLGHVVGSGGIMADQPLTKLFLLKTRELIYLFHMPAFFMLAGYLWKRRDSGWGDFLKKKVHRLLIPYIVFSIGSVVVFAIVYGYRLWWQPIVSILHAGDWPAGEGFKCNSVLWFLPVMFICLIAMWVKDMLTSMFNLQPRSVVVLDGIMCIGLLFLRMLCYKHNIWYWPWGVITATWYFPFMIMGVKLNQLNNVLDGSVKLKFCIVCVIFVIARWLRVTFGLYEDTTIGIFLLALLGFCGSLGCIFISKIIEMGMKNSSNTISGVLEVLGMASMGIMLFHKFCVVFFQAKVLCIRKLFLGDCTSAVIGSMIVTIVSLVLSLWATKLCNRHFPALRI